MITTRVLRLVLGVFFLAVSVTLVISEPVLSLVSAEYAAEGTQRFPLTMALVAMAIIGSNVLAAVAAPVMVFVARHLARCAMVVGLVTMVAAVALIVFVSVAGVERMDECGQYFASGFSATVACVAEGLGVSAN